MTPRERIRTVLSGGVPDRVPFHDSYWGTTVRRWHDEGLPPEVSPEEYFGCELSRIGGDYTLQFPVYIKEETERFRIYTDSNGATRKDLKTADGWTPGWLDFRIKGRDDWDRFKARAAYNPSRIAVRRDVSSPRSESRKEPDGLFEFYRREREKDRFITYSAHGCFHPAWQKIGMENLLILMLEDPYFIEDMFATHAKLIIDIYEGIKRLGVEYDGAWISDDLGYRNATLISPAMYGDLVMPHHKRICDHFAADGLKTILHSDGNVGPLIPQFMEAGFSALHPLEAKAGLDVRHLKSRYEGRLVLFGNIDVRKLAGSLEDIEQEIRDKVTFAKQGGGYLYHSDHSVPHNVSLENYRFAVEMLNKYGGYE